MKLGIYLDLRNPPQWRQDPARLHGFTLELCEEADRLGIDSIWVTEHHGFEDGYLAQPLTFLAAVAARTRRARLGTAILLAALRHPAHIAEEAALVDIISGGRLELGLGAGYRIPEFTLFDADPATRHKVNDSRPAELRRLWAGGAITPPPVQNPVPIWLGYLGLKGAYRAGRLGERLLSANVGALWQHYRQGLLDGGHDLATARMAGVINAWASDDPERDWPMVSRHMAYQTDSYRREAVAGTAMPPPRPVDMERLRQRDMNAPAYFVHDTPEAVAAKIKAHTAGGPVETVYLWASIAGMAENIVADNVRRLCTRLRPLLA